MSNQHSDLHNARNMVRTFSRLTIVGAFAGIAVLSVQQADARPGGGMRPSGAISAPRSGGPDGFGRARAEAPQRGTEMKGQRTAARKGQGFGASAGDAQRPAGESGARFGADSAAASGNRSNHGPAASGNRATGVAGSGNRSTTATGNTNRTAANSGVVGSGNGNSGAVNNGNVGSGNGNGNGNSGVVNTGNVAVGNDVDVDVNNGWGGTYGYGTGAAYATGLAVGASTSAAAATTAHYSTLPSGCSSYYYSSNRYYSCGGTWYQQTYQGNSVVYVVVTDPSKVK